MVFQITHDAMPHTLKSLGSFSACFLLASSSSTELSTSLWVFLLNVYRKSVSIHGIHTNIIPVNRKDNQGDSCHTRCHNLCTEILGCSVFLFFLLVL